MPPQPDTTIRAWHADDVAPKHEIGPDPVIARIADDDPAALAFANYLMTAVAGWQRRPRTEWT